MKYLLRGLAGLVVIAAFAAGGLVFYGPERLWTQFGGPADQGAVEFARLKRSPTPNDGLACSPGACAGAGIVNVPLPFYEAEPSALLNQLDKLVLGDPNITRVDEGSRADYRRYVARTPVMRFPDTIDVETEDADGSVDGTVLRMYSRSLLGESDLGTNKQRLTDWAARIAAQAQPAGTAG